MVNPVAAAVVVGLLGLTCKALRPPRSKVCGSPGGPSITSPRVNLNNGRHLVYREFGVPKEEAKYKIIVVRSSPWLLHRRMSQKWFPSLSFLSGKMSVYCTDDLDLLNKWSQKPNVGEGEYESLHRDLIVGLGKWEFSPIEIKNPIPEKECSVQIWQGYEDRVIPYTVQRSIHIAQTSMDSVSRDSRSRPFSFIFRNIHCDALIRALLS